jgi:hypothetical protein
LAPAGWPGSCGGSFSSIGSIARSCERHGGREGRYLLRTNRTDNDPAQLMAIAHTVVAVEKAFRNLKGDLAIRPIFHKDEGRIGAHIFIAFLAYCMQITLTHRLHSVAPGLTARSALEQFAAVQIIDVHLPTTDGHARFCSPATPTQSLNSNSFSTSSSSAYHRSLH